MYTNPVSTAIRNALIYALLTPYRLVLSAIPESIKLKVHELRASSRHKSKKRTRNEDTTQEAQTLEDQQLPTSAAAPPIVEYAPPSTEERQKMLLSSSMSVDNVTAVVEAQPAIPGIVLGHEELLPPMTQEQVNRRRELLISRIPALPPAEPKTYARHYELPEGPRVHGRPRDRKTHDQTKWWGSGLPQ
jgi:hypothetical protein